jgi:hypothetical protein
MTINRTALRAIIAIYFAALLVIYTISWLNPAIGLFHDDAVYLVTAKAIAAGHGYRIDSLPEPVAQTEFPPLFPALLAVLVMVSHQAQWLKLLPLACAVGWLVLIWKLLLRMGASRDAALFIAALTAASPTVVSVSTNLMAEPLFAMFATAALLTLLEERVWLAGLFAGLATLTMIAGVPLIVACIVVLVVRSRFRGALVFAAVAMAIAAPWFGWALAHPGNTYAASNVLTALPASEKLVVLGSNFVALLASPAALVTGLRYPLVIGITVLMLGWSFIAGRQLLPDIFVALYCLALLVWIGPPERSVAPILPLILWIAWRAMRSIGSREALAAVVLITCILPLAANAIRHPPPDDWKEMEKLFTLIRAGTTPASVLLANTDSVFYLNTGRKAVRGFVPGGFDLFYAPRQSAITPDRLSNAILQSNAGYVALTPDAGLPESAAFHKSVEALERGGIVEPVTAPGASPDYRLLKVIR